MSSSEIPPPRNPGAVDEPSMVGGGIYFRWNDRLWQEQADGRYLVWDEESRAWEESSVQPPPQPGESRETKECPNCGKRIKATLRHCPFCEFGFENVTKRAASEESRARPAARERRSISAAAVLLLIGLVIAAAITGVFLLQRSRACDGWESAVDELTQAKIDLQGLPRGSTQEEFRELNEALLADQRPGGCE